MATEETDAAQIVVSEPSKYSQVNNWPSLQLNNSGADIKRRQVRCDSSHISVTDNCLARDDRGHSEASFEANIGQQKRVITRSVLLEISSLLVQKRVL